MTDENAVEEKSPAVKGMGSSTPTPPAQPSQVEGGILPASHWQEVPMQGEVEEDTDGDSISGFTGSSSTTSVASSIRRYRTLYGRTYHSKFGNAEYWGPNDEQNRESQDVVHVTITLACDGKLYLAPLVEDNIQKVLDVGTGSGAWAIDFADQFSGAEVIGTDLSPMQHTWAPPNLKFEIDDCTQEWTYSPESFDYIHLRWLLGSIADWSALMKEAYKACKPGGWVESCEPETYFRSDDGTVLENSAMAQWIKFFTEGQKKTGRPFTVVMDDLQRNAMEEAGFVDIKEFMFKIPLGSWPKDEKLKEVGVVARAAFEADIEGYVLLIANTVGWTREEIMVYLAHLRRELRSPNIHAYYLSKVVWGRKPVE